MLTIAPAERHDCPNCRGTRLQMIGRNRLQIVLRCMKCGWWFGIRNRPAQTKAPA